MRYLLRVVISSFILGPTRLSADDWPMWRHDAARSAESQERLPDNLSLLWTRELPPLKPAFRTKRLQFDASYEPIVMGKTMFVGSSFNDSLTAYDTDTGRELWRFYTEGPVRFAPVAWEDRVFVGSDDGNVYCLNAIDGTLRWKLKAVPSDRKVVGNGRLISMWPIRGGLVLQDGKIYFAAGVWSFEGVFVYCVDAKTGEVLWRNDESGYVYGVHPHGAEAFGGVTPQGYLVVNERELIVPCGQAYPATFDLATGKLKEFELPAPGRLPGSYFASADLRRGEVTLDKEMNSDLHEDKTYVGRGVAGARTTIKVRDRTFSFSEIEGVEGDVSSLLAADGKLFAVKLDGRILCFGPKSTRKATTYAIGDSTAANDPAPITDRTEPIVKLAAGHRGFAVVRGVRSFEWLMQLVKHTELQLIVIEQSQERVATWRRLLDDQRLYAQRVTLFVADPATFRLPPYFASFEIVDSTAIADSIANIAVEDTTSFQSLRPYGGMAILACSVSAHESLASAIESTERGPFTLERLGPFSIVHRDGSIEGAVNYTGGWSSPDEHVRAPLGVLWFDDTLGHFKRSPQPWFVDGVMISLPKDWMEKHRTGRKPPYDLLPPVVSDVYTGRVIEPGEALLSQVRLPARVQDGPQPSQYRPPTQVDAWKPKQPIIGDRINPLTGEKEPRTIPKSYGCDGGVDYGNFFTMRSGTPAFYDKRLESGVCNISGPRSGCTNSIIPACGVLNVPYFYEGCTCSYPLPAGLTLVNMPPTHEQWASWGPGSVESIQRVGINFGAPGDRMTEEGTLWLEHPIRGGMSPDVHVSVEPESAEYFYRHSVWIRGGEGWPWVAASGVKGASAVKITGLKPGLYTLRLYFAEMDDDPSPRRFTIAVGQQTLVADLDVIKEAGGAMQSIVRETNSLSVGSELRVDLTELTGKTLLSGIEVIRE
ncbi:MAG: PQQ-binding-like beta-propeller repeat protein [Planctomycetaceae bacterium]|nr:PQQ-binding-like beta-propeller repeat protein [Planctomycetales bacterium]MCB9926593.1 PQQ-binding-like beta-propeller repeat protein [Planctomycetaceae bacterium]